MSLRNTINRSLLLAWNQLKDLAVPATLIKRPTSSFDFASGSASANLPTSIPLKVVIIDEKRSKSDAIVDTQIQCLFKLKDTGSIGNYDELQVGLDRYRVSKPSVLNNGFVVTATLEKL